MRDILTHTARLRQSINLEYQKLQKNFNYLKLSPLRARLLQFITKIEDVAGMLGPEIILMHHKSA